MKLSPGVLSLLLDPDAARDQATSGSSAGVEIPREGSLPERWERLQQQLENPDADAFVRQCEARLTPPAKLLAGCDRKPLSDVLQLPAKTKGYMEEFLLALTRDVELKTNLRFRLPPPLFASDSGPPTLEIPRHSADLSTIAFEGSRRLTLKDDRAAFSNMKETGVFKRGDYDVTFQWYPGKEKIERWRRTSWGRTLYRWGVSLPSVLVGLDPPSVLRGLGQFVVGSGTVVNRAVGIIPSKLPKYSEEQVEVELAKSYFSWLERTQGFEQKAVDAVNDHQMAWPSREPVRYVAVYEHPTRGRLDFRTFIPTVRRKLEDILRRARRSTDEKMSPSRMAMVSSLSRSVGKEKAIDSYLEAWHDAYRRAVAENRKEIDALSSIPDLTDVVLRERDAELVVARHDRAKRIEFDEAVEKQLRSWIQNNPVKAANEEYVERERSSIVKLMMKQSGNRRRGLKEKFLEAGLNEYAVLFETQDEFERSETFATQKRELAEATVAWKVKISTVKLPMNWKVKSHPMDGRIIYEPELFREICIPTTVPMWRILVFGTRCLSWTWNGNYKLMSEALIGVRRWNLSKDSFSTRTTSLDEQGRFQKRSLRTLRGRLKAVFEWRKNLLEEARNSEHIIRLREGMYLDTCWAHFWSALGVGISSVSVTALTVVETVGRVALFGAGALTSPIWSVLANVGYGLSNALIYDRDFPHPAKNERFYDGGAYGPLLSNQLGVPEVVTSTGRAIWHLLGGAFIGLFGEIRHAWNRTWHGLMTLVLGRAEVPTQAQGFFWRTGGPGMQTPFILVDADTAIVALLAFLSLQELHVARLELNEDIEEPRKILEERIRNDSAGTMSLGELRILKSAIDRSEIENRECSLQNASGESPDRISNCFVQSIMRRGSSPHRSFAPTRPRLPLPRTELEERCETLLKHVRGNRQVRFKEQELEAFMARAIPLIKKFHIERYFPRIALSEIAKFWEERNLSVGDWLGLTEHIASSIFNSEINVPFEAASDDLVIEANQMAGVEKMVQQAFEEQGIITGSSVEYSIGHPVQPENFPTCPGYIEVPVRFSPVPE